MTRAMVLALAVLFASGCRSGEKEDEAFCKEPKPGVVTTVNSYCVVVLDDTVDPSVEPVEWRGVKYGLCCEGCRPKWAKMSDAQRDAAVAKAVAKTPKP